MQEIRKQSKTSETIVLRYWLDVTEGIECSDKLTCNYK